MTSLYVHIPFCRKACHYCNFHFSTQTEQIDVVVQSLQREIVLRKNFFLPTESISSIYFGGGTPSLLSAKQLSSIIEVIDKNFNVVSDVEITIEANAEDVTATWLTAMDVLNIQRLSIGVQSFQAEDLRYLGRFGYPEHSHRAIELAVNYGVFNLSVDLIYGMPTLSISQWRQHLKRIFTCGIPHVSCYALTLEENTALSKKVAKASLEAPTEQLMEKQFILLMKMAKSYGYEQYEISNFAINKNYSAHNLSYWRGNKYLGIGPSAHSYNGSKREWNVNDNLQYVQLVTNNQVERFTEVLTPTHRFNESIMLQLRTKWGVNLLALKENFLSQSQQVCSSTKTINDFRQFFDTITTLLSELRRNQLITLAENGNMLLTNKGKLLADGIARELFFMES